MKKGKPGTSRSTLLLIVLCAALCTAVLAACDSGTPQPPSENTPGGGPATPTTGPAGDSALGTEVASIATPTTPPTPVGLTDADAANIYAVVVDALLGEKVPSYVYLGEYVSQGERLDDPNETHPLPAGLMPELQSSGGGTTYEQSSFEDAIGPLDEGGKVKNDGVYLSLGDIMSAPNEPGAVLVRGSTYRNVGEAEGDRFTLVRDPSEKRGWKVSDSTQEWTDK